LQCRRKNNESYFGKNQFEDAVRFLLGVGIYNGIPVASALCNFDCGKVIDKIDVTKDIGHGMCCNKINKLRVWRHNSIRDGMEELIKSMDSLCDIGSEIVVGHRMTTDGPVEVRTDLLYNVGPDSYVIDFVVTNPSSQSLNIHGLRAYEVTNGAAIQAEKLKR
jgi:hypothetical protein